MSSSADHEACCTRAVQTDGELKDTTRKLGFGPARSALMLQQVLASLLFRA
jgi:hypothetical protein